MANKVYAVCVGQSDIRGMGSRAVIDSIHAGPFDAVARLQDVAGDDNQVSGFVLGLSDDGVATRVVIQAGRGPVGERVVNGQLDRDLWAQLKSIRAALLGGMRHGCGPDESQDEQDRSPGIAGPDDVVDLSQTQAGAEADDGTGHKRRSRKNEQVA